MPRSQTPRRKHGVPHSWRRLGTVSCFHLGCVLRQCRELFGLPVTFPNASKGSALQPGLSQACCVTFSAQQGNEFVTESECLHIGAGKQVRKIFRHGAVSYYPERIRSISSVLKTDSL